MLRDIWKTARSLLLVHPQIEKVDFDEADFLYKQIVRSIPNINVKLLILEAESHQLWQLNQHSGESLNPLISSSESDPIQIIEVIKSTSSDIAVILTKPLHSPYSAAYLCYLAGIPVRIGFSDEFGGGLLSHSVKPLVNNLTIDYWLHLLKVIEFPDPLTELAIA